MKTFISKDELWPEYTIEEDNRYFNHEIDLTEEELARIKSSIKEFYACQSIIRKKIEEQGFCE